MCRELLKAAKGIDVEVVTKNSEVICEGHNGRALFCPFHTLGHLSQLYPTDQKQLSVLMTANRV